MFISVRKGVAFKKEKVITVVMEVTDIEEN